MLYGISNLHKQPHITQLNNNSAEFTKKYTKQTKIQPSPTSGANNKNDTMALMGTFRFVTVTNEDVKNC